MNEELRLIIGTLALFPFLVGSLRLIALRLQRDREWAGAREIWHFEKITITHHANGDISLLRNRGPGLLYMSLGTAIMVFSVPVSFQTVPKLLIPLNSVIPADILTGIMAGSPLWVMLVGLVLLTFAAEWFMTEDTIISNNSGTVKIRSFWTRWTKSWRIKTFHALHHATDGKQTAIYLKFKASVLDKRPLAIGVIPYSEADHTISLLRSSLNLPTTSEYKKNLEAGNSPWD